MTTNLKTLSYNIGTWCARNFDTHHPDLGFVEEIGELAHAVLKHEQKIRGEQREAMIDALADAGVFLLHWCHLNNCWPQDSLQPKTKDLSLHMEKQLIAGLIDGGACMLREDFEVYTPKALANFNWRKLVEFAEMHNLDYMHDCFLPTWEKVSQRDWRKFPKNGVTE